jgi:hypothetical protein
LIFGRIFFPCSIDYCRKASKITLKITIDPVFKFYKFNDITVDYSDSILCPFLESKLRLKKGSVDAFILMSLPRQEIQRENEACKIIRNHSKAVSIAHRLFKMCQKVRSVSFTAMPRLITSVII